MTSHIDTLAAVASNYEAIVLDQWGVLHDGTTPYLGAISILESLVSSGTSLAVLSNSGKRGEPNANRISQMGFAIGMFETVMTSGEALWRDIDAGSIKEQSFFAIERSAGDAKAWADGLDLTLCESQNDADAILLMGLPDGATLEAWLPLLDKAKTTGQTIYCSNPDRASPRKGGQLVVSPGALAIAYKDMGGDVRFYGKPHLPIFRAVERALGTSKLLMVGDSLEHDIAGAQHAGWDSCLVQGGLYAKDFATGERADTLARLVTEKGCKHPTYTLGELR